MEILLIGMNHKTAPVEIREKLSLSSFGDACPLRDIMNIPVIKEAMYLSTCNRVEVLACTSDGEKAKEYLKSFIFRHGNLPPEEMEKCLYVYFNGEAIRHLFRVASSLDSLVMGEPQILGQVKEAYREALKMNATGVILNRLLHHAFSCAKRVRTETAIASNAVSVSYAAVELAKKIFGDLKGKTVLIVGAGDMAELAARHLMKQGVGRFLVTNRTFGRAVELAKNFGGEAFEFFHLPERLAEVDIVLSSTGAAGYIITAPMVAQCLKKRRNRLLFLIDIAVPRDIEPEAGERENVFLYNIDDLQEVVDENLRSRLEEARKAETIIEEEANKHQAWMNSLLAVPTIVSLKEKVAKITKQELEKSSSWLKNLSHDDRKRVEILLDSVVNKIVHDPITTLKEETQENGVTSFIAVARRLFRLD